ncbi:hypothetical protein [Bacillus mesophilum]|uniref:DUF4190 domain-containing protein n=1 Tax=Bacillus mesophilum TaxID=1071718 RepID=A0A7V7UW73_9BACI|nr:hypothetical protein [Bacillus mesophilum]KAB2333881.1 hypothetical protein F7732_07305 [Bacillus mesophilum]
MADQDQKFDGKTNHRYGTDIGEVGEVKQYGAYGAGDFTEETSAEIAAPVTTYNRSRSEVKDQPQAGEGKGVGYTALILSILSLFIWPVLMGAAGIVLGFVASRRGSKTLGGWAIGIGAVSIIIGLFILPFF